MNRKGFVIGAGVLIWFSLIFVALLMVILLLLASGAYITKSPTAEDASSQTPPSPDLLLQPVTLTVNEKTEEYLVHDALALLVEKSITLENIESALNSLQQKTGNCYSLSYMQASGGSVTGVGGNPTKENKHISSQNFDPSAEKVKTVSVKSRLDYSSLDIDYYYGACEQ